MERQLQHRRLQHEAIAASTATTLYGALVYLNRGGLCKEPLSPAMFARPNLKGLQAVLHLLHHRIRGAARTKKVRGHHHRTHVAALLPCPGAACLSNPWLLRSTMQNSSF